VPSGNRLQPPGDKQAHRIHTLQTVARFLTNQPHPHIPRAALRFIAVEHGAGTVLDVLDRLHILGFIRMHRGGNPTVAVLHHEGLRRLAAGDPLPDVAIDIERGRALTIIRTANGQYAAWYLPVLLLPASACTGKPDWTAAVRATANEAVEALQQQIRAALHPEPVHIGQ
jgi:hypothetical protein